MFEQATGTAHGLEAHLIARAWRDEAFKQELLRDPNAEQAQQGHQRKSRHPFSRWGSGD